MLLGIHLPCHIQVSVPAPPYSVAQCFTTFPHEAEVNRYNLVSAGHRADYSGQAHWQSPLVYDSNAMWLCMTCRFRNSLFAEVQRETITSVSAS